ncbi:hypothetical protein BJ741DRAFT_362200 [Chytriomyces cf. hyalinus JEL632]|nr:hypothetical protein BJ741DRAFT_362200 [Chytriomyces cf. hyalinus JEL632]
MGGASFTMAALSGRTLQRECHPDPSASSPESSPLRTMTLLRQSMLRATRASAGMPTYVISKRLVVGKFEGDYVNKRCKRGHAAIRLMRSPINPLNERFMLAGSVVHSRRTHPLCFPTQIRQGRTRTARWRVARHVRQKQEYSKAMEKLASWHGRNRFHVPSGGKKSPNLLRLELMVV